MKRGLLTAGTTHAVEKHRMISRHVTVGGVRHEGGQKKYAFLLAVFTRQITKVAVQLVTTRT